MVGIVRVDGRRQVAVTTHCISTFFRRTLSAHPFEIPEHG
jgi:hypothetical protein